MKMETTAKLIESISSFNLQQTENVVHGNRPGDDAARTKKLGETLPPKTGIVAGEEFRAGDKVPCRDGDIIAGVCKAGNTARETEQVKIKTQFLLSAANDQMLEACKDVQRVIRQAQPHRELAPCK